MIRTEKTNHIQKLVDGKSELKDCMIMPRAFEPRSPSAKCSFMIGNARRVGGPFRMQCTVLKIAYPAVAMAILSTSVKLASARSIAVIF